MNWESENPSRSWRTYNPAPIPVPTPLAKQVLLNEIHRQDITIAQGRKNAVKTRQSNANKGNAAWQALGEARQKLSIEKESSYDTYESL